MLNNENYLIQHITNNNKKLLIHISGAGKFDTLWKDRIDTYSGFILDCDYDIIYIRSKLINDMWDAPCEETFKNIKTISSFYNHVDGLFMCGGSVLGLYFSKLINYKKIFCISARFLDNMTMVEAQDFKFINHRIEQKPLNQNAQYNILYNKHESTGWDKIAAQWLKSKTLNNLTFEWDNTGKYNRCHTIEGSIGTISYIRSFIPSLLDGSFVNRPRTIKIN